MNHRVRAKGLVGRAFPRKLLVRDGDRQLRIDVTAWHDELTKEVARGLRRVEMEAYRHGVSDALNEIGDQRAVLPEGDAKELFRRVMTNALDLHKRGPR